MDSSEWIDIGKRIKELRKSHGLSQKELGKLIGVSGSMIGQYETGQRRPKIETIMRITSALGIEWTDIAPEFAQWEQIDKYTWGREAGPEVYRKLAENYQRHHGGQARANAAMDQMDEEGKCKVADYAEDILPRYRRQDTSEPSPPPSDSKDAAAGENPVEGLEKPGEGE